MNSSTTKIQNRGFLWAEPERRVKIVFTENIASPECVTLALKDWHGTITCHEALYSGLYMVSSNERPEIHFTADKSQFKIIEGNQQ
jgi:hypothetical protein